MGEIQIYSRSEPGTQPTVSTTVLADRDFSEFFGPTDARMIETAWEEARREGGGLIYSTPRSLGALWDTREGLAFIPTDFKTYVATVRTCNQRTLSEAVYQHMRVSAVSAAVRFKDDMVLVHRRPAHMSHCPNLLDSSVGGLAVIRNGSLNPRASLDEKLERELKLVPSEIQQVRQTGIHSSNDSDHSGIVTYLVESSVSSWELQGRTDPAYFSGVTILPFCRIPAYVLEHYGGRHDMTGDGCATLLAALEPRTSKVIMEQLRQMGRTIRRGALVEGRFEESKE